MEQSFALAELKTWLGAQGFRFGSNPLRALHNDCEWYAWRRSSLAARECETNGHKCQLVITPYRYESGSEERESVNFDVTGETAATWFKLEAYGLSPTEARDRLPAIESALVRAWNALAADPSRSSAAHRSDGAGDENVQGAQAE